MKLTKAKIDEAQKVLAAMAESLDMMAINLTVDRRGDYAYIDYKGNSSEPSLYDSYINALHAKAGTTPPPF